MAHVCLGMNQCDFCAYYDEPPYELTDEDVRADEHWEALVHTVPELAGWL